MLKKHVDELAVENVLHCHRLIVGASLCDIKALTTLNKMSKDDARFYRSLLASLNKYKEDLEILLTLRITEKTQSKALELAQNFKKTWENAGMSFEPAWLSRQGECYIPDTLEELTLAKRGVFVKTTTMDILCDELIPRMFKKR